MDEEEYQEEEQSDSKINLGSFFERVDSVEKVASNALSKANANFSIIENQKALINSLNVSIEAIETKVRDIANYIIIEKKITKDEEADKLVEEQDKEQKDQMIERLMGMKGDQGDQGEPGQPEEEKGGNPIMSFLKGLATLGIAAFVTTQMWPVLLPLIGPLLGKLGFGLMAGAGTLLGGFLGAQLFKVPIVGKKMGPAVEKGIKENFEKGGKSIQKAAENMGKDGKLEISTGGEGGGGEGGAEEVELKDNLLEGGESLEDTLKENDLIGGEPIKNRRGRIIGYEKPEEKDLEKKDLIETETQDLTIDQLERKIVVSENKIASMMQSGANEELIELERDKIELFKEAIERKKSGMEVTATRTYEIDNEIELESVTENKDLDLSLNTVEDEEDMTGVNDANILSQVLENPSTKGNQIVAAPSNKPNTTTTDIKLTKIPIHFLNTISNPHLSITGDEIPPEFYRQYT
tara:strand:+ start:110 stop:1504 length:1395 start_codon:yes stop_codon:yes gene_type:complete